MAWNYNFSPMAPEPGRSPNTANVNQNLYAAVSYGGSQLPAGYTAYVRGGYVPRPPASYTGPQHVSGSQHYIPGSGALDITIRGPDGKEISNEGTDSTGMYQRVAQGAYGWLLQNFPNEAKKLGWGGNFAIDNNPAHAKIRDLMHFDYGGDRGNLGPRLASLGPLKGAQVPMTMTAAGVPKPQERPSRLGPDFSIADDTTPAAYQPGRYGGTNQGKLIGVGLKSDPGLVKAWQQSLADTGLYSGQVDGKFGPRTIASTMAFQMMTGATPDGKVGDQTRAAMKQLTPSFQTAMEKYAPSWADKPIAEAKPTAGPAATTAATGDVVPAPRTPTEKARFEGEKISVPRVVPANPPIAPLTSSLLATLTPDVKAREDRTAPSVTAADVSAPTQAPTGRFTKAGEGGPIDYTLGAPAGVLQSPEDVKARSEPAPKVSADEIVRSLTDSVAAPKVSWTPSERSGDWTRFDKEGIRPSLAPNAPIPDTSTLTHGDFAPRSGLPFSPVPALGTGEPPTGRLPALPSEDTTAAEKGGGEKAAKTDVTPSSLGQILSLVGTDLTSKAGGAPGSDQRALGYWQGSLDQAAAGAADARAASDAMSGASVGVSGLGEGNRGLSTGTDVSTGGAGGAAMFGSDFTQGDAGTAVGGSQAGRFASDFMASPEGTAGGSTATPGAVTLGQALSGLTDTAAQSAVLGGQTPF